MTTVFLSYSTKDHFFAELARIKLAEDGISLWHDQGQLRAGTDWRNGIEQGISQSVALVVALSNDAAESSYVTFEWAYGLGKGKPVIPLKLGDCSIHPRLESIQHLDFSISGVLPWSTLIERIREIETDITPQENFQASSSPENRTASIDATVRSILAYLEQRGYQMASFERLRRRINESLSDQQFNKMIVDNPTIFRHATLKDGKPGLAKIIP